MTKEKRQDKIKLMNEILDEEEKLLKKLSIIKAEKSLSA